MAATAEVAAARRWFRLLGHQPMYSDDAIIVSTPATPKVWDANFALAPVGAKPDRMLDAVATAMDMAPAQIVITDALTDPAIEAALALAGFEQGAPVIELLALGAVASPRSLPSITIDSVTSDADWRDLATMIRVDHAEGKRTGAIDASVGEGLIALMHQRGPGYFRLIRLDGAMAGYGMAVACPGGLGLIESLFTLPQARGRGVMSAFIVAAAAQLRGAGCSGIFLDAHAHDTPRLLYHRLGFAPVAVWRYWTRRAGAASD